MLEPPAILAEQIAAHLQSAYSLAIKNVTFLPLGADPDTAVYHVAAPDATAYFLKLRSGVFPEATVAMPAWLAQNGMRQLIAPIRSQTDLPWIRLDSFVAVLYPFVEGESGWNVALTPGQWADFGHALRELHTRPVPRELLHAIPRETYSPAWRNQVAAFLQHAEQTFDDPVAADLAALLRAERVSIEQLLDHAEDLAAVLAQPPLEYCLCHGDIHAGNLLIDTANHLYLVDWDTIIIAPKERDLMFIGAGIGGIWNSHQETNWFYQGYGPTTINPAALAYYRCERIVQDIAVYCDQLLTTNEGGADRRTSFEQLAGQFEPGSVVEIALRTKK